MNLIDGLPRGRSGIADSAAALRPVVTEGAVSQGGTGAAFDDILSQVSRRDGVTDDPSAQPNRSDAATPASIHGAFSVNIAVAMQSDGAPRPPAPIAMGAATQITAGDPASAASGDFGRRAAVDSPVDQTPDVAPWLAKAAIAKTGIEDAGGAIETDSGGAVGPAGGVGTGGLTPAAQSLALPSPSEALATDVGGASAKSKRSIETDAAPAAVSPIQTSALGGGGETAGDLRAAAFFGGATAGARSPAFSGRAGVNAALDSASVSKSSASARGVAWARPAGRTRPDGATGGSERDPAALQASTQTTSPVGAAAAPSFSLALLAGAASISEHAGAALGASAARPLASDGSPSQTRSPAPMIAVLGVNAGPDQSPPARIGDASGFSSIESPPVSGSLPDAPTEQSAVKVAVLGRQTHFPPLVPASPVDQIANRIATGASPGAAGLAADAGGEESSGVASAAGAGEVQAQALSATRVLHLQLDPEGLGAVSIKMRLSGNRLDLQLESDRADTMRRIGDDSGQLVEKLRAAGYVTDHLVVRVAEPHMEPTQQGLSAGENSASESHGGAQAPSPGMSQQGGSNADAGPGAQRDHGPSKTPAAAAEVSSFGRDDSGAVYL